MAKSLTSDFLFEFACTPCSDEENNREASVYCVNCKEYFCKSCFRFHNRVADAKQHQIVDKSDFHHGVATSAMSSPSDIPTEKCSRHHDKAVDMHCGDHDQIGCSACIAVGHRSCKDVSYIPDIAESRLSDKYIYTVQQGLSKHIRDLANLKHDRLDQKVRLTSEKDTSLAEIKNRMDAIIEYVRTIENSFTKDVMNKYEEFADKLGDDEKVCNESMKLLESMYKRLQTSVGTNVSQTFIDLKQAESLMRDVGMKREACEGERNGLLKIAFEVGNDMKNVLSPETVFGRLHAGHITPTLVEQTENINVKMKSDKSTCGINDLCSLPDGTIIMTDGNNNKLKSLHCDSAAYRVSGSLSITGRPWGVCCLGGHEVAVTVPTEKQVTVVHVDKTMSIKNSFKVDCKCYGIACSDRRLIIANALDSSLTVYDLQGNCLQTIFKDHTGKHLFDVPRHLCVLTNQRYIAVADENEGVTVLDMSGNLVTCYKYRNMKDPYGVCVDDCGTMFVVDYGSRDIVVLGVDKSVTFLSSNVQKNPHSLFYDARTKRLFVTSVISDHIVTYNVVY